jgi:hypothetical protein
MNTILVCLMAGAVCVVALGVLKHKVQLAPAGAASGSTVATAVGTISGAVIAAALLWMTSGKLLPDLTASNARDFVPSWDAKSPGKAEAEKREPDSSDLSGSSTTISKGDKSPDRSGSSSMSSSGKRGQRLGETASEALAKGDLLTSRQSGGAKLGEGGGGDSAPGALARVRVNGPAEFVSIVRAVLSDFERRASPDMLDNVRHLRSIAPVDDGAGSYPQGGALAYVRMDTCDARIYPSGWQATKDVLASILAHEAWHCSLYRAGRRQESAAHGASFWEVEKQAALELYGGGGLRRPGPRVARRDPCPYQ